MQVSSSRGLHAPSQRVSVRRRPQRLAVLAGAALAWSATAYAVVPPPAVHQNNWIGATGLNWSDPANWSYDDDGNYGDRFWSHGTGRKCFELDAEKRQAR